MTTATGADTLRLFYLLLEDPIFEEWLENPVMAAMVDYLMRGQAQLSSLTSFIRWHNSVVDDPLTLALHADAPGSPENVLPEGWNVVCNGTLVLTEYTKDNVPSRWYRAATGSGGSRPPARRLATPCRSSARPGR